MPKVVLNLSEESISRLNTLSSDIDTISALVDDTILDHLPLFDINACLNEIESEYSELLDLLGR